MTHVCTTGYGQHVEMEERIKELEGQLGKMKKAVGRLLTYRDNLGRSTLTTVEMKDALADLEKAVKA